MRAGYEVVTRYNDLSTAYYLLASSLENLGELKYALVHYMHCVQAGRTYDTFDDEHVEAMLRCANALGQTAFVRKWFEDLAKRDPKMKRYMQRLLALGKL